MLTQMVVDANADDGANAAVPTEDAVGSMVSHELLEREKEFRKKNQALKNQTKQVLKQAEDVVREGKNALERPLTAPPTDGQTADDAGSDRKTRRPNSSASVQRSRTATDRDRPSSRTAHPPSRVGSAREGGRVGFLLDGRRRNLLDTDDEAHGGGQPTDDHSDALMGLPRHTKEEDLGSEATTRFLKAKLHVLQQELDKIVADRNEKDTQIAMLNDKLRAADDEVAKANRALAASQATVEKMKKMVEEVKYKSDGLEIEVARRKKEMDDLVRQTKQAENDASARDLRLNRALEEVEKYKTAIAKKDGDARDKLDVAKRAADTLFAENKKLQRQKSELLAAFKKQAQLVSVLKRQKMHVEAVKLLQFTEDEFVRALNWDL
ncbi:hypothetical protein BC831DRAFT_463544 [Entophlyctis helioformis]|nr:hypothetical protein BC831DRAFT_463544 [Entophlyctis helioformis]